ncbi:MAG: Rap1a/Tai family immunity protein [Pseudomonadota bacterium]
MRKILAPALLALIGAVPAAAEDIHYQIANAGDLAWLCARPSDPSAIHMCQGFLVGVHRMHLAVAEAMGNKLYCPPGDGSVTRDSVSADFAAWVGETAGAPGMAAHEALLTWAQATYPCT